MNKLDITAIVLTYNEEIHIRRCLESINEYAKKVYVVDCHSSDRTREIAVELGSEVVERDWPGNQAAQFNWALDNLPIDTEWVLRLDADEYFTQELIDETRKRLPELALGVSAVVLPLGRAFMGRILKHGIVNEVKMIRLFRYGKARYEERMMDEHLRILEGTQTEFRNKFIDDNRCSLKQFVNKHNGYSSKEAAILLDAEYGLTLGASDQGELAEEVAEKRRQKAKYAKMPLFWRSLGYYLYRRWVKLGVLDGKEGFLWDFFQGLWYRMLVDAKVWEAKKTCGNDKELLKKYIHEVL
ncbi:MAG: glycosyltransferase family 2 protein [Bacteroidales bacterium]|nr:glycosyltransferase family 2 protein [Bacteroidales bacterium]